MSAERSTSRGRDVFVRSSHLILLLFLTRSPITSFLVVVEA